jgi:outer membrane usher protein
MEDLPRRSAGGVRAGVALRGASHALCLLVRARCLLLALDLTLTTAGAAAPIQRAVVPLFVNTVPKGDVPALLVGDDVLLRVSDLSAAGVSGFAGRRESRDGEEWISLASLAPGVSYRLDLQTVTLSVTVPPTWLAGQVLDLGMPRPTGLVYLSSPSLFANYAVNVTDLKAWNAFGEAGLSLGGNLFYSALMRTGDGSVVRGLSNVTHDDRDRLVRWVAGDGFAGAGGLGGSLFLAGLSVSRSFDLDPYFVRYPAFALTGAATTPSTIDVYVNGNIVKREAIGPGTFQLSNILLPAGNGTTRVVVRDAFGQEREMASGFYASTAVLAKGLSEFTYNLGFRRDNLSMESWDYGSLSFLGRHRYGFSSSLTAELRLEADDELVSGGPGFAWRLPFGEVEGYVAASRERGQTGGAASLSYRYVGQPVNYGVFARTLSPHYAALGLSADQDRPHWDGTAFVGVQLGRFASLTLQYTGTIPRDAPSSQRASLSSSSSLTRDLSLFLSFTRVFQGSTQGNEAFVGLSYFLGHDTTALASFSHQDGQNTGSIDVQKSLPVGTGLGYRFNATAGDGPGSASGLVQYNAPFGRYEASVLRLGGETSSTLSASGGIVALGGTVLPTRPVVGSFALIRVPGLSGVHGTASNQDVGTTNTSGDLLIPSLIPYYGNRIGIADGDVPIDYEIGSVERTVATPYRGGAVVEFPVKRVTTVTGRLLIVEADMEKAPAYGELTVTVPDGRTQASPVGGDGGFYLENLSPGRYPAAVEHREAVCRFTLVVPVSQSAFVNLGTLRCAAPKESGKNP